MPIPWETITTGALGGSLLVNWPQDEWSRASLVLSFAGLWAAGLLVWGVWTSLLYPFYRSPLRHLPQPGGDHWLLGQGKRIMAEATGLPMRQW